jgi:hypothetical protein
VEAGVVGVLGALVGILLSNVLTVLLDLRRRHERVIDVQTSLRAEIRSHWRRLGPMDLEARAAAIVAKIREEAEKRSSFTPFIPREDDNVVFENVASEIHILPNDVIDAVVLYYSQLNTISRFVEDLRSDTFATLEPERKIEMYRDYIAMKGQARDFAEEAIRALDVSLASQSDQ